jgi:hypothetical protein
LWVCALASLSTLFFSKYLKTRSHSVADNYPASAHTQTMRVQSGRLRTHPSQHETVLSKTALAGPVSPLCYSPYIRFDRPILAGKTKKVALYLVQSALNTFIINRISRKSRRKNAEKRAKTTPIQSFSRRFGAFSAFAGAKFLRHIAASTRGAV